MWKKIITILLLAVISVVMIGCQSQVNIGYLDDYNEFGSNEEKVLRTSGGWTKTGFSNHFHGGGDAGPLIIFGIEGLVQYIRTTDEFYYLLAESIVHNDDGTSLVTIRDNAKWFNGDPVVAIDFLSYYVLNTTDMTRYVYNMEVIDTNDNGLLDDDKELLITWKPWREPTDYAKTMLIALDTKNGSVQYKEFKVYIDYLIDLVDSIDTVVTEENDYGETRFGKVLGDKAQLLYDKYNEFRAHRPDHYIGNGAYMLESYSENQMVLVKNPYYYNYDLAKFERLEFQQYSNTNQIYADLSSGKLDYVDGLFTPEIMDSIFASNPNLVSYKYYDQGTVGMYFNLEKTIWDNDLVREAFQYIFDRSEITQAGNPYAITSFKPMMVMSNVEARQYLSVTDYNRISNYSYNQTKAQELLIEAGWEKRDGKWYNEDGDSVELNIGFQDIFTKPAQAVKSQLEQFGITVSLKNGGDWTTWFGNAKLENSPYDCVVAFTELNTYGTHPGGSMKHFFDTLQAHILHLDIDDNGTPGTNDDEYSIEVDLLDGTGRVRIADLYRNIYTYNEVDLAKYTAAIVVGFSEYNYGVQFYENIAGSLFDLSRVGGLPLQERFSVNRNITYIPDPLDDAFVSLAKTNIHFTQAGPYVRGEIYPRT